MNRTQTTLLGLLLLQLVLIAIFRAPLTGASVRTEARSLLPQLEALTAERMQIDGDDDERITLVRRGAGWTIEELGGFPADTGKIDRVLEDLEAIEVRRPVVTSSSYHEAFKVADDNHEARLRIWGAGDDDPPVDLILGSSSNYRTTHARLGDESEVYEIQGIAPYDLRPARGSWIRKELADDVGEVEHLSLQNASGRYELERADGTWRVVSPADRTEEELDQDAVLELLRSVTGLRLADAVGPVDETAQGFAEPAATLVLRWGAGEGEAGTAAPGEVTLRIGSKVADQETQRYVTRSGLDFAGTIWESSIRRLLDESLDDLRLEADSG